MIDIFKLIFGFVGDIFSIMNTFVLSKGVSLLTFYLGFLLLPLLLVLVKFGFDFALEPVTSYFKFSNAENAKNKYEQRRYIGKHEWIGRHTSQGRLRSNSHGFDDYVGKHQYLGRHSREGRVHYVRK